MDLQKLRKLRAISRVPILAGEQFLTVMLDISTMENGVITFGIDWKTEMGEIPFDDLDTAIAEVRKLRKRMKEK